jgi:cytochrome c oxidase subunit 2
VPLEIAWTAVPLAIALLSFAWGAKVFVHMRTPPQEGMQFLGTGKQWMWKLQHPTGQREINSLHVPVGQKIVLTLTSEDVIHDFFVPAFRVKADVLPGAYNRLWFEATQEGTFHLFCAEYCGTKHSEMIGQVIAMDPAAYEQWLAGQPAAKDPVEAGKVLFENLRCDTCHAAGSGQRGPDLANRFGTQVRLHDGQTVLFDEDYARESILEPTKRISAGYQALMPTYQGQVDELQILHLIAYVQSLTAPAPQEGQR